MNQNALELVDVVNRLRRGTLDGKVLWQRGAGAGSPYSAPLDGGYTARVCANPAGSGVVYTMETGEGLRTVFLDTTRPLDDLLRLAVLQLFVAVRDTVAHQVTADARRAVEGL